MGVPLTHAGAGAQGSIAIEGSNADSFESTVAPEGQAFSHDWLNNAALEKSVPPPNTWAFANEVELSSILTARVFIDMGIRIRAHAK